jgi:hypothetical protein
MSEQFERLKNDMGAVRYPPFALYLISFTNFPYQYPCQLGKLSNVHEKEKEAK